MSAALAAVPPLKPVTHDSIAAFRSGTIVLTDDQLREGGGVTVEEREVPGEGDQPPVGLLVLRPTAARVPGPGVVNIHGGGLIGGSNRSMIRYAHQWVRRYGVTIVSIDYRLAPEHPYPAAHRDCRRAVTHVAERAVEFGIDPERLLLAGISAGGGLALGVALKIRDCGGPRLAGVLALAPMLDDRNDSVAVGQTEESAVWAPTSNATGWTSYLGSRTGGPDVPAYAAAARAADVSGLPPVFLDVGSAEAFRTEVVDFAERIWAAGGECELHVWPGGCHAYEVWAPEARISRAAKEARDGWAMNRLGVVIPGGK